MKKLPLQTVGQNAQPLHAPPKRKGKIRDFPRCQISSAEVQQRRKVLVELFARAVAKSFATPEKNHPHKGTTDDAPK